MVASGRNNPSIQQERKQSMATPTIEPPQNAPQLPSPGDRNLLRNRPVPPDHEEFHLLIAELRDEASRSRMREAIWISIILHLVILFSIRQLPKWWPERAVTLLTPEQVAERQKSQELVFNQQPPDSQQVKVKPNTNKISDKDRLATSKNPNIDRRTLERLANNRREGAPGMNPQQPFAPPPQPQAQGGQPTPQQMANATPPQRPNTNPNALEEPQSRPQPNRNIFANARPAGSAVDQAVRDTARNRGGISGEFGGGPGIVGNQRLGNVEILTDTMGVDFAPYMQRVIQAIRENWYTLIPESARSPLFKQGNVYIQFIIGKDGKVSGMRLEGPSGDVALDRAAWGGITASNPFPPLPQQFAGPNIALRIKFMYNPSKSELQ
jgi:TonB family protein